MQASEDSKKGWHTLSQNCKKFIQSKLEGLNLDKLFDSHVHICGMGKTGSGCYVNSKMEQKWTHPLHYLKLKFFMAASGITGQEKDADASYVDRLLQLLQPSKQSDDTTSSSLRLPPIRALVLALDEFYNEAGEKQPTQTGTFVPNAHVLEVVKRHPDLLVPACSVHPYRKDALDELKACHAQGARVCKWLPNSQGIDLGHWKCIGFYKAIHDLDMTLLIHTGDEHSVDAGFLNNELGNPLKLRFPLSAGCRVIAAHCASEGSSTDTDQIQHVTAGGGGGSKAASTPRAATPSPPKLENFQLFLRLMREKQFESLLYGDISAMTAFKRTSYLTELLDATELHPRLLFGTDYPVPALPIVFPLQLVCMQLITMQERQWLNEIAAINPIWFDLLLKRTLKTPKGNQFAASVFERNSKLF